MLRLQMVLKVKRVDSPLANLADVIVYGSAGFKAFYKFRQLGLAAGGRNHYFE